MVLAEDNTKEGFRVCLWAEEGKKKQKNTNLFSHQMNTVINQPYITYIRLV